MKGSARLLGKHTCLLEADRLRTGRSLAAATRTLLQSTSTHSRAVADIIVCAFDVIIASSALVFGNFNAGVVVKKHEELQEAKQAVACSCVSACCNQQQHQTTANQQLTRSLHKPTDTHHTIPTDSKQNRQCRGVIVEGLLTLGKSWAKSFYDTANS
jgi:hypothetical protein